MHAWNSREEGKKFIRVCARRTLRRSLALALGATLLSAAAPPTGLENVGRKLVDSELSEMRGKFVAPEGVSYFGMALQTVWQSSDGMTTMATVLFNLTFGQGGSGDPTPKLYIGWTRSGDPAMDVPTPSGVSTAIPAGFDSVNGVVQSQLINGADNSVRNSMTISVVNADEVNGQTSSGLTEVTSGRTENFEDGDTIQFILKPGEVALALKDTDGDLVRQGVSSDLNQASQHVLLNSNFNSVTNAMAITLGVSELQQTDRLQVENALSAMKGRGF